MSDNRSTDLRATAWEELSPTVHWAQRHRREQAHAWSRRTYDFELLHLVRGSIAFTLDGSSATASEGQLVLLPARAKQDVDIVTGHAELLGIHFDFFGELDVTCDADIIVHDERKPDHAYCAMPSLNGAPLLAFRSLASDFAAVRMMEAIIQEWNERKPGFEFACKGLLLQLFARLHRLQAETDKQVHRKYEQSLNELAQRMETEYSARWTNAEMARLLSVHEDYMSKLFKAQFGSRPMTFLAAIRHREAKRLLRETDDKLELIANRVGYDDLPYFCRLFKQKEGITAIQYRKFARI